LDALGYAVRSIVVGAEAVGAPHRRNRVWIVAYRGCERGEWQSDGETGMRSNGPHEGWEQDNGQSQRRRDHAIPDSQRLRCRAGSGMSGDESETQRRRSESTGGVQLAGAAQRGLGTDGIARDAGHAEQCKPDLVNPAGQRCTGRDAPIGGGNGERVCTMSARSESMVYAERESRRSGNIEPVRDPERGIVTRWPMPPGPNQHGWEAPRLIKSGVGQPTDGLPRRVVGFARRNALQALGDSIVPQVAAAILRAWKKAEWIA